MHQIYQTPKNKNPNCPMCQSKDVYLYRQYGYYECKTCLYIWNNEDGDQIAQEYDAMLITPDAPDEPM